MKSIINCYERNPDYYLDKTKKSDMGFTTTDGRSWYCAEGNHRTVLAKFVLTMQVAKTGSPPILYGVYRSKYSVDWLCFIAYKELSKRITEKRLNILLSLEHLLCGEINSSGQCASRYKNRYHVIDLRYPQPHPHAWLTPKQFLRFANIVIASDGNLSRQDRLRHYFLSFGRQTGLIEISRLRGIS